MKPVYLVERAIEVDALIERVAADDRGGVVTFLGTVRDHHEGRAVERLEYCAYVPMAEAECERIRSEAESRWPVRVTLEHRIGALGIGDVSVGIAVAGAHREEAFEACRYVIEELKRRVPIWKREYFADGSVSWVDPSAPFDFVPDGR